MSLCPVTTQRTAKELEALSTELDRVGSVTTIDEQDLFYAAAASAQDLAAFFKQIGERPFYVKLTSKQARQVKSDLFILESLYGHLVKEGRPFSDNMEDALFNATDLFLGGRFLMPDEEALYSLQGKERKGKERLAEELRSLSDAYDSEATAIRDNALVETLRVARSGLRPSQDLAFSVNRIVTGSLFLASVSCQSLAAFLVAPAPSEIESERATRLLGQLEAIAEGTVGLPERASLTADRTAEVLLQVTEALLKGPTALPSFVVEELSIMNLTLFLHKQNNAPNGDPACESYSNILLKGGRQGKLRQAIREAYWALPSRKEGPASMAQEKMRRCLLVMRP